MGVYLEWFIESFFIADFIFCFLEEYQDNQTYTVVSNIKLISINYMKGSFAFDFLAIIPFYMIFSHEVTSAAHNIDVNGVDKMVKSATSQHTREFRLMKLLRVPRLLGLLNVDKVKGMLSRHFNAVLTEKLENGEEYNYPIEKNILMIEGFKIFRIFSIIMSISFFLGIFWHIFVFDIQVTYFS